MGHRSDSPEADGLRSNDQRRRFRIGKFKFGQRGQNTAASSSSSTTDGRRPSREEAAAQTVTVTKTLEQLLCPLHLHEASALLIEREERLYTEIKEAEPLKHHKDEEDKLGGDYGRLQELLQQTLRWSLSPGEGSSGALRSALKAIDQEEEQDARWKQRDQAPPSWRPHDWRQLHDATLHSLVEQRMDNPSTPPAEQVQQSSIQTDVHGMGRQLKDDLLLVVDVVRDCYPPEHDICNVYAKLYHQHLSSRLRKIAEFVLDDRDCTFILRWVNEFYPQILQKPALAGHIDVEALDKLLPAEQLQQLEEQFLGRQQDELMTFIGRVLDEATQKWREGEEPSREDGCFVSPVAYDIIQLINGMVSSAQTVVGDRLKAQSITCRLTSLMQRFKSFQNDIMKQNKTNSRPFIKANLGCIEQFSDVLQNNGHLFPEGVRGSCLTILSDMKQSAHTYLLKPVHEFLKPQYRKLGTSDWLKNNKLMFEKLLSSMEQELQGLQGAVESCHQKLIGQLHQEVTAEYVKRLLKGEVKLKDSRKQLEAFAIVSENAESLHDLFSRMGSREDWLRDILTTIAEVLKLQDLPAIQMQVVSLATTYPDFSVKHVSALLKLKTNLSKASRKTVKETLSDTLREDVFAAAPQPFFCTVHVK